MTDLAKLARLHLQTEAAHMSLRQIAMLGMICDDPNVGSIGDIAKAIGAPKTVVTRAMQTFEIWGLAIVRADPNDRRRRIIRPTEAGQRLRASFLWKSK